MNPMSKHEFRMALRIILEDFIFELIQNEVGIFDPVMRAAETYESNINRTHMTDNDWNELEIFLQTNGRL